MSLHIYQLKLIELRQHLIRVAIHSGCKLQIKIDLGKFCVLVKVSGLYL